MTNYGKLENDNNCDARILRHRKMSILHRTHYKRNCCSQVFHTYNLYYRTTRLIVTMLERFVLDSVSMTANTLQRISIISCVIELNRVHLCLYLVSHSCEMTKIFNYIQLKLIKFQQ